MFHFHFSLSVQDLILLFTFYGSRLKRQFEGQRDRGDKAKKIFYSILLSLCAYVPRRLTPYLTKLLSLRQARFPLPFDGGGQARQRRVKVGVAPRPRAFVRDLTPSEGP